jgi:acyl carrier protein
MGLDAVELIMDVEKTFGIEIDEHDLQDIRTVGGLHAYVLAHAEQTERPVCCSAHSFYHLRRALVSTLDLPREALTPSSDLASLLPLRSRRRLWARLGGLDLELPRLQRGPVVAWGIVLLSASAAYGWTALFGFTHDGSMLIFDIGVFLTTATILYFLTDRIRFKIPGGSSVGDVARAISELNFGHYFTERPGLDHDDIWTILQQIVVDQLAVKPSEVTYDARFIEDLGMD